MIRFFIISIAMICLSVAGAFALSIGHAAFGQRDVTDASLVILTRQGKSDSLPQRVSLSTQPQGQNQQFQVQPIAVAPTEPGLVMAQYRPETASIGNKSYAPETSSRPRERPDNFGMVSSESDRSQDPFAVIELKVPNTYRPRFEKAAPRAELYRPRLSRDTVRIDPIPGYLIGVFR